MMPTLQSFCLPHRHNVITATKEELKFQSFDKVLYLLDDLVTTVISHTTAFIHLFIQAFID